MFACLDTDNRAEVGYLLVPEVVHRVSCPIWHSVRKMAENISTTVLGWMEVSSAAYTKCSMLIYKKYQ